MRVFSIDPGSNYGWAFFEDGHLVAHGDFEGRHSPDANRMSDLMYVVGEFWEVGQKPDAIVIENVVQGSHTMPSWEAVWHTVGVQYLADQIAQDFGIPVVPVGQLELKRYLMDGKIEPTIKVTQRTNKKTGKVAEYHRKTVDKKQIVAYVNEKYDLCLRQKHHNVADAIALGEYYLETKAAKAS